MPFMCGSHLPNCMCEGFEINCSSGVCSQQGSMRVYPHCLRCVVWTCGQK